MTPYSHRQQVPVDMDMARLSFETSLRTPRDSLDLPPIDATRSDRKSRNVQFCDPDDYDDRSDDNENDSSYLDDSPLKPLSGPISRNLYPTRSIAQSKATGQIPQIPEGSGS